MQKLLTAGFWLCLVSLPLPAPAQDGPAIGHQNLRLGMSIAEALAAEPLARSDPGCPPGTCLGYFDRRFLNTGYSVLADFGPNDSLRRIALSMVATQGEAPCRRELQSAARDFSRIHGAPDTVADGVTTWRNGPAAIALADGCAKAAGSTIAITIDSQAR